MKMMGSPEPLGERKQGSGHATSRLAPATPAMIFLVASQFDDACLALMLCGIACVCETCVCETDGIACVS